MVLDNQELGQHFGIKSGDKQESTKTNFVKDCQLAGYEPTPPEIDMYFFRNAFCEVPKSELGNIFQRCMDIDGVELTSGQSKEVDANLASWGNNEEIIGNPAKELASNLYLSLSWRLEEIVEGTRSAEDAKEVRNSLLREDSDTQLKNTIPYMAKEIQDSGKVQRAILKIVGFKQHQAIKKPLSEFGFGFGVVARKALEKNMETAWLQLFKVEWMKEL